MKALLLDEIKNIVHAEVKTPMQKGVVTGVTIDSRDVKEGDLFVALKGEQCDGHDYIADAVSKGAAAVLMDRNIPLPEEVTRSNAVVFKVDDAIEAMGQLARFYRQQCGSVDVIAVTGSTGKTTVREMIYQVMSHYKKGCRSPKNYNNHIGLPLSLFAMQSDHDFVVVEIGTNAPGEVAELSRIAEPNIAVITKVGQSHLEGLKDVDGVSLEKASIAAGLKKNGVVVCSTEHPETLERVISQNVHVVTFGLDEDANIYAQNVRRENGGIRFETNDRTDVWLPMPGMHNVSNALAALAVCRRLGITCQDFAAAIKNFQPVAGRLIYQQVNGITIIDDCYNANPVSMYAAIDELMSNTQAKRRVLVCGDMGELGDDTDEIHQQLGRDVYAKNIDVLLTVGPKGAIVANTALEAGMGHGQIMRCINSKRMARLIKSLIFNGDVILVKGSRSMHMEQVVESLQRWRGRQ